MGWGWSGERAEMGRFSLPSWGHQWLSTRRSTTPPTLSDTERARLGIGDPLVIAATEAKKVAVAAITQEAAEAALAAIEVVYEPLPAVFDVEAEEFSDGGYGAGRPLKIR